MIVRAQSKPWCCTEGGAPNTKLLVQHVADFAPGAAVSF